MGNPNNWEDLQKLAEIDDNLARNLKRRDCKSIFNSVRAVMAQAEDALRKDDKSNAYVFYRRAGTLCGIISNRPEKSTFAKTEEGREYMQYFNQILDNIEGLMKELKAFYQDRELAVELNKANLQNEIIIQIKPEPVKQQVMPSEQVFDELITAKQLVDFAKNGRRVLIIDYRARTDVQINFKEHSDGNNIVVALCPPQFIESNITLVHLSKVMPIRERQKVDKKEMEKYDLVVFMDDDNPKKSTQGDYLPPANHLLKGLTIYAYNNRLKRRPVFLKGGFKMWSYTYGIHTNQEFNRSLFSEDDEFGKILNECRQSFDINYPDLVKPRAPEPPWPSSTGGEQPKNNGDDVKWRQIPIVETNKPSNQPPNSMHNGISNTNPFAPNLPNQLPSQQPTPINPQQPSATSQRSETSFGVTPDDPPVSRLPTFDRSQKPTAPPRGVPLNNHNQESNTLPQNPIKSVPKSLPAVGTLGGARVADPATRPISSKNLQYANGYSRNEPPPIGFDTRTQATTPTPPSKAASQQPYPNVPPRPPTPDRSTKVSTMSQADTEKLLRLYTYAYNHLESRSQTGRQPGVGFRNMGNTCFMNTTLQAIINTPKIKNIFTRNVFSKNVNEKNSVGSHGTISAVFSALVDLYFSGTVSVISPEIFLTTFAQEVNRELADRRQHDAQEFQIFLMDALHEDTNRVQNRKTFEQNYDGRDMVGHARDYDVKLSKFSSSPIMDNFYLRTISIVKCSICGTSSASFEDQPQITLELQDNTFVRLDDCLRRHFKIELLQNDCRWNCPTCKRLQVATRQTNIWRMPKNLVIHFKRFTPCGNSYVKNDTNVHFDIDTLRLDQYLHEEAPQQKSMFSLYAVTNHTGTLNSGHYTSYVRNQHRWLKFDDDFVSEVSREALQSNKAFVLFYTANS